MNAELLLSHYERIAEAPDAIARLRRLILDLAVRGKLVEQDPNDELSSSLSLQSHISMDQLTKSRQPVQDPVDEEPFPIPKGWLWTRLGAVCELIRGISFPASAKNAQAGAGLIPCFRSGNIQKTTIWDDFIYVPETCVAKADQFVRVGDILISIANSYALVGKCSIVGDVHYKATFGAFLAAVRMRGIAPAYAKIFLSSEYSAAAFRHGSAQTTNIANITFSTIRSHPLAVPPLAEQHRIIAKVDELMALCDQLEAAQAEREAGRDKLTMSTLVKLNEPDPESFPNDARFALEHLKSLTKRTDQIKQLRQTILNLAVRGKLVEQDPNEEPASELLKRIAADKLQLIAAGQLRSTKPLPIVEQEQFKGDVPSGWIIERLGNITKLWNGYAFKSGDFQATGVPVIRIGDLQDGQVNLAGAACVSEQIAGSLGGGFWIPEGALLLAMSGATTGKTAFNNTGKKLLLNQRVGRIEPFRVNVQFIKFFFETIISRNLTISFGTAIPNLSAQQINETVIPLPPIDEQHRIVAKVAELMALCDQLEASLVEGEQTRCKLLEAVLHEALEPAQ